jgi:hypothetical protein
MTDGTISSRSRTAIIVVAFIFINIIHNVLSRKILLNSMVLTSFYIFSRTFLQLIFNPTCQDNILCLGITHLSLIKKLEFKKTFFMLECTLP